MSIISAIQDYIKEYAELEDNAPVWVGYLGAVPTEYAIVALAGPQIVVTYITGASKREFAFAFQSVESTADDVARLETLGFFETFSDWLESQTTSGNFPTLGDGKTATKIQALGRGYLIQEGESKTGIYQIQCKLDYEQDA